MELLMCSFAYMSPCLKKITKHYNIPSNRWLQ
jgi:hypothetical protein